MRYGDSWGTAGTHTEGEVEARFAEEDARRRAELEEQIKREEEARRPRTASGRRSR